MVRKASLILFILLSISIYSNAQKLEFNFLLGQYDHTYNLNGEFNQIITETSNTSSNLEFLIGLSARKEILNNLEVQLGIINFSTFVESMLFYDTTEDQIFGEYVRKAHAFGARTYSFPLNINFKIPAHKRVEFILGAGIEYFLFIDSEPLGTVDLGRQHPRLNDFLPRIDKAFFRNRLVPFLSIGLRYKRFGLELQTRIKPKNSFSTFEFEGQEFQPPFTRSLSNFLFSYNFLRF